MTNTPLSQSLTHLGLNTDADERSVKRAYAAKLKKIDQEKDPEGFQRLRHAYEVLLDWARRPQQENGMGHAGAPEQTPQSPYTALPSQQVLEQSPAHNAAHQVLLELTAQLPESSGQTEEMLCMLRGCLDDARLINLDEREHFEWLVGRWLLESWKPSNQALFEAAVKAFEWDSDGKRLLHFGQVGLVLEAARNEWALFQTMSNAHQIRYQELIKQLRMDARPSMDRLMHRIREVEVLLAEMPNWLRIIAPIDNAKRWRETVRGYFDLQIVSDCAQPAEQPRRSSGSASPQSRPPAAPTWRLKWWAYSGAAVVAACLGAVAWRFA